MSSPIRRVSDGDRERAALELQRACGDGRLTLEEFSVRVGAVWASVDEAELAKATADLAPTPIVGSSTAVDTVVSVFGENKRRGRWRLRSGRLKTRTVFGSTQIDLREVITDAAVIEITGVSAFGEVTVIVPEGVEVDLAGSNYFSAADLKLAPKPRLQGTPEVRVEISAWFSAINVVSKPYSLDPSGSLDS